MLFIGESVPLWNLLFFGFTLIEKLYLADYVRLGGKWRPQKDL